MARDDGQTPQGAGGRVNFVRVCSQCGMTAHLDRRYCGCHAPLNHAEMREAEKPELDRLNFGTAELSCADCPEDCRWCLSFGRPRADELGFGGLNCRYRTPSPRCGCCLAQAKPAVRQGQVNMEELIKSYSGERLLRLAEYMRAEMEQPVRNRIAQRSGA